MYQNGQVSDGLYTEYYPNGYLKLKCMYKNGKRNGTCEEYTRQGDLKEKMTYVDDCPVDKCISVPLLPQTEKKADYDKLRSELNERLIQINKQMAPTQLRRVVKRQLIDSLYKKYPQKQHIKQ